jgi:hypothetical protein
MDYNWPNLGQLNKKEGEVVKKRIIIILLIHFAENLFPFRCR